MELFGSLYRFGPALLISFAAAALAAVVVALPTDRPVDRADSAGALIERCSLDAVSPTSYLVYLRFISLTLMPHIPLQRFI